MLYSKKILKKFDNLVCKLIFDSVFFSNKTHQQHINKNILFLLAQYIYIQNILAHSIFFFFFFFINLTANLGAIQKKKIEKIKNKNNK